MNIEVVQAGKPGIFCHMKSVKGIQTLMVHGHARAKVVSNLLHFSGYHGGGGRGGVNIIHTEH